MSKYNAPWKPSEDAYLKSAYAAGLSLDAISEQIPGRSRSACKGRANYWGLRRPGGIRVYVHKTTEPLEEYRHPDDSEYVAAVLAADRNGFLPLAQRRWAA